MTFFSRVRRLLFGHVFRARRLEALGRLQEATVAYLDAGMKREAARVIGVRAESTLDPVVRLSLLAHALSLLPDDALALRRARLALELVQSGTLRLTRSELKELGATLERLGESMLAAEAYGLGGELDAQARALVSAGAVERLERVLESDQAVHTRVLEREAAERSARDFFAVGRRREALALLDARAAEDDRLAAERRRLLALRVLGPRVELELDGAPHAIVFGERVVVGRNEAGIAVAAPCVSREHLALCAGPRGPEVRDLASRNATTLAGARLAAPLVVDREIVLVLGGEVELRVEPWGERGLSVCVGADRHLAPLGGLKFGPWLIDQGRDFWIEARSDAPFYLGHLRADARVELCRGDELRSDASGPARIKVPG